jgi:hypothetical protein
MHSCHTWLTIAYRSFLAAVALLILPGCNCRREPGMPAPSAPTAPDWSGPGVPRAEPKAEKKGPARLQDLPMSKVPPAHGLPLEVMIKDVPQVPPEIRGPTPLSEKR